MTSTPAIRPSAGLAAVCGAMAGGLGWGIRGQYGHETGAMIAGVLVSLTLAALFCAAAPTRSVLRAVAWATVAMGMGGSMTYGQTVGLTQDAELVGNGSALVWGLLGLAIKGGLWIGFAGAFLGMGLGGAAWRPRDLVLLLAGLLALCAGGIWLFNEPFDPARKVLPALYFSDSWRWEPDALLKPRREVWGGFLLAFAGLLAGLWWGRRDVLGFRLGLWGLLGGGLGFPLGQCLQAYHAWNRDVFQSGIWASIDPILNWWNFMETTFGAIMGAALGLGLALNRDRIRPVAPTEVPTYPLGVEFGLLGLHLFLLIGVEFFSIGWVDAVYDFGLVMAVIPLLAVTAGRVWPWLVMLPVTAVPIVGKTLKNVVWEQHALTPFWGWILLVAAPLGVITALAVWCSRTRSSGGPAGSWLGLLLMVNAWLYTGLNFAVFQCPWPWQTWTVRTPNAMVFGACLAGLSWLAADSWRRWWRDSRP